MNDQSILPIDKDSKEQLNDEIKRNNTPNTTKNQSNNISNQNKTMKVLSMSSKIPRFKLIQTGFSKRKK